MKNIHRFLLIAALFLPILACSNPLNQSNSENNPGFSRAASAASIEANKKGLITFFWDNFKTKTVSGQMNLTWDQSIDMLERVKATTGKYPALQGFDFMNYTNKGTVTVNANNQTSLAQSWWENAKGSGKNGIVTFCWHWRDPSRITDSFYKPGYQWSPGADWSLHIPITNGNFDPNKGYGPNMVADMNVVAAELAKLRDAGVPVLWRPLHEGSGNNGGSSGAGSWFWWGYDGAEAYKALYKWMYNYFTNVKGLNNLIWVWNGQDASYYPGDAYVDMGGWDVYAKGDHSGLWSTFDSLRRMTNWKLAALTEVGSIPDPDNISSSGAWWSFFLTWNDGNGSDPSSNFWSGNFSSVWNDTNYPWNRPDLEKKVFLSEKVLTLDELPALNPYVSSGPQPVVLYDFEGSTQGWKAGAGQTGPWSVTDWAASASNSLKANVTLASGAKFYFSLSKTENWIGKTSVSLFARSAAWGNWGSGAQVKIYVKTGAGWTWKDSGPVSLTSSSTGTQITLPLATIANVNDVREIGVEFIAGSGASGSSSIYIDKVVLQ